MKKLTLLLLILSLISPGSYLVAGGSQGYMRSGLSLEDPKQPKETFQERHSRIKGRQINSYIDSLPLPLIENIMYRVLYSDPNFKFTSKEIEKVVDRFPLDSSDRKKISLYFFAKGLKKLSFYNYEKAAELGSSELQFRLAQMYVKSYGHTPYALGENFAKKEHWLKRAAQQGHLKAMNELGFLLLQSREGRAEAAYEWFFKAAQAGSSEAKFGIGLIYNRKMNLVANTSEKESYFSEAKKWFTEASKQEIPDHWWYDPSFDQYGLRKKIKLDLP